jgi:hypothetical protein
LQYSECGGTTLFEQVCSDKTSPLVRLSKAPDETDVYANAVVIGVVSYLEEWNLLPQVSKPLRSIVKEGGLLKFMDSLLTRWGAFPSGVSPTVVQEAHKNGMSAEGIH